MIDKYNWVGNDAKDVAGLKYTSINNSMKRLSKHIAITSRK